MRILLAIVVALSFALPPRADGQSKPREAARPSLAEPSMSPDGKEIAFVSAGDVWVVPVSGGVARLLVASPATESRPLYSPDGRRIAFVSTRSGDGDIYVLTIASGALSRLTYADGLDQLDAWSRDGRWIYFTTWVHDLGGGMQDILRVRADGGTPMEVSADRFMNEYFSAPSPDGATVAFTGRGSGDWVRRGHSHRDESELWLLENGPSRSYRRLTDGGAKEQWPMWSADGARLFYVSDRGGVENIWVRATAGTVRQLTRFTDGRVLWPSISADGRTIVFERDFRIWILDTSTGQARPVPITRPDVSPPSVEHLRLEDQIRELTLSPDGAQVAFVVHDEVFVASAREGGNARRVTVSPASETQVTWSPDGGRLAYRSDRGGTARIFLYDLESGRERPLSTMPGDVQSPRFSPKGDALAFIRDGRELRVVNLATGRDRLVANGYFGPGIERPFRYEQLLAWSPDSRWIVFVPRGGLNARNPHVVAAAGGVPRPVSVLHNLGTSTVSWSPDGRFVLFDCGVGEGTHRVARVELRRKADAISFDRPRERVTFVPSSIDVKYQAISPDGKWALLTGEAGGQTNLHLVSLDEIQPAPAKQLTSSGSAKGYAQFSPDGGEVFFLEQGRIKVVSVESRAERQLPVVAEMDVDFAQEKLEVFQQVWSYLDEVFPDSAFLGTDWKDVRARYAPRIAGAATGDELRRLIRLAFGELNASHLAIGSAAGSGPRIGTLGLDFDRLEYERSGRLRVRDVVPFGPADLSEDFRRDDYVLSIDGTPIGARANLDSLLDQKIGKRVVVGLATTEGGTPREAGVRATSLYGEQTLRYRAWVERNRQLVSRASGGRLGYVHLRNMTDEAMARLYLDLDEENRAREGIVVDIRNNFGGVTNGQLVDLLSRRDYLTARTRAMPDASGRTLHGQQMVGLPTVLVTNRQSISDAENFTEGYRALHLGPVVGEPTAGFVIQYGLARLIDGSIMTLPETMLLGADGVALEMHPRPVDVFVAQPMGETYTGNDAQLEAAVRQLLRAVTVRRTGRR